MGSRAKMRTKGRGSSLEMAFLSVLEVDANIQKRMRILTEEDANLEHPRQCASASRTRSSAGIAWKPRPY